MELAPLPASAQFLNVIESVFSGMAKAIIHNSDYESVEVCKAAIDRYFAERNAFFLANPKRAGRIIWGKEADSEPFLCLEQLQEPEIPVFRTLRITGRVFVDRDLPRRCSRHGRDEPPIRLTSDQRGPLHPASEPSSPRAEPLVTRTPIGLPLGLASGGRFYMPTERTRCKKQPRSSVGVHNTL